MGALGGALQQPRCLGPGRSSSRMGATCYQQHAAAAGWQKRLRRARGAVQCWATIPVPDNQPFVVDLGWPTDFAQHYVKGKLIGQGSFGSVYLGIDLHTGKEVAIKVMPKQRGKLTKERTLQKLAKEVGILQKMQACRNAVRLLGCYEARSEVMVVTDLCSGGDLQKLSDDHGALPERAVALIAYEVLQVVEECHKLGILHGDLKPANFVLADRTHNPLFSNDINLLFGPPWLLAIDFGCSQYLGATRFTKRTGTPVYMAPEVYDRDYHWEADMWSLGIMLYQLYARRFPYWKTYEECRHAKLDEVALLVAEAPLPMDYGAWRGMSEEGRSFMAGCLERDYAQRMTVTQALNHPWLNQWLPDDDLLGLDSLSTSSSDDDVLLPPHSMQLQQQQQAAAAGLPAGQDQQQQQHEAHRVRRHHHQQPELLQQQQQQPQQHATQAELQQGLPVQPSQQVMVVVPGHLQQSSGHSSGSPLGQAPGAYSSSTGDLAGSDGQPQQQQHSLAGAPVAGATGAPVANNVVPGSSSSDGKAQEAAQQAASSVGQQQQR